MNDESETPDPFPSAVDVDHVLAEFDGDHGAAITALLHDVKSLASDLQSTVSRGFIRIDLTNRVVSR